MPETTREQLQELARLAAAYRVAPGDICRDELWEVLRYARKHDLLHDEVCDLGADCPGLPTEDAADLVLASLYALPALLADAGVLQDAVEEGDPRLALADLRSRLSRAADALAAAQESHEKGDALVSRSIAAGIRLALAELAPLLQQAPPAGGAEG